MKSKTLKIRNIPKEPPIIATISVKPTAALIVLLFASFIMILFSHIFSYFGVILFGVSSFCLFVLPDRKLLEFTHDYVIFYNCKERGDCTFIYWEDILTWQYIWHPDRDELEIELVDHSVETVECFSKKTVVPLLRAFARDKEKIIQRGKRVKAA
ncbi:hypothetical protein [Anaerorhabdus sp.]|jgi:hypothetical protein|uniref:hypothetical protein n=1 Tax=Anaerorhabdus sp. TaxID=1872524 RepID=UPI002FC7D179